MRFRLLGLLFDVVDGRFLDFDHDTHFVEELGQLGDCAFNLLDILVTRLDFAKSRSSFTVTSRCHQLPTSAQPPKRSFSGEEGGTYSLREDLSTLIIFNGSLNFLLRSIRSHNPELPFHSLRRSVPVRLLDLLEPRNGITELLLEGLGLRDHRLLVSAPGCFGAALETLDGGADRVGEFACFGHHGVDLAVGCLAIGVVGDVVEGAVVEGVEAGYVGV
jgi:hypothetical protein